MEHRTFMRRTQSVSRFPGENNSKRKSDLTGSLSLHSASGWFNRGKVNNSNSTAPSMQQHEQEKTDTSTLTSSSQQQQARVQEIAQSHSLEQRFLSKMRESGVVTSAGYQAVLRDFVAGDRTTRQADNSDAAAAENVKSSSATTSTIIDRRAEMLKAQKSSSRKSSSGWGGSSRRFSSFFTACPYSHENEALTFGNDAPEASVAERRTEMLNSARQSSSRKGSRRLFGSFFTAVDDDDFLDRDNSNRVEANIAPLRRSAVHQSTQEAIECNQLVANEFDDSSHRWSIASSLSDSIHLNSENGDEGERERLEKHDSMKSELPSRDSNTPLNLEENCQKQDHSSDQAAEAKASANTRRNFTSSVNFDPAQSTKNAASKSEEEEEELSVEQDPGAFEVSESFCTLDDCAWLPWPERRECIIEDKDNESCASGQPLYDDNFLPWPESPRNGRALAA